MIKAAVPALRFPEFSGEWPKRQLKEMASIGTGSSDTQNRVEGGAYPFFVRSDTIERIDRYAFDGEAVLTSGDGVGVGKNIHYINGKFDFHQRVYAIHGFGEQLNGRFFYQFFKENFLRRVMRLSAKNSVDSVRMSMISDMLVPSPILPEQLKIADFLGAVDARAGLLRRRRDALRAYKKGMMQRLFSQELRFTKPDGSPFPDWQDKRLGEVAVSHNSGIYKKSEIYGEGANIIGVSDLFSISVVKGQEFRRVPLTEKEIRENALNEGDILYAESSLVRKGIAKSVYVSKLGAGTAFAWHTRRYAVDAKQALAAYIYFYLESDRARRFIESVATQTALTGITTRDYFACPVSLPHTEEQQKIADTLTALDTKIDALTDQIDAMRRFKKGLLQQMFV